MESTAPIIEPSTVVELPNSSIRRWVSPAGARLFEKRYRQDEKTCTLQVIQARMSREQLVNDRLQHICPDSPRLGIPKTIEFDFIGARIVMAEAPGEPLLNWIRQRRTSSYNILRAMHLAGGWLRMFQSISVTETDRRIDSEDSLDLASYCQPRLEGLIRAGAWSHQLPAPLSVLAVIRDCCEFDPARIARVSWIHGDYGPFNVLWDGRVLTGIDLAMARVAAPLIDATYFIHRLEMLALQRPWNRYPIEVWKRAFLRGYGDEAADRSPFYQALMIRHCLNRMSSLVERPSKGLLGRTHDRWLLYAIRHRLRLQIAASAARSKECFGLRAV